jgi:hypothetical protein
MSVLHKRCHLEYGHIGPLVEQLRAEVHTIDETASSLTTPTTDPSPGETPQALNGGFRSDVASTRYTSSCPSRFASPFRRRWGFMVQIVG